VDVSGHDTDLALVWLDDTRAVGADDSGDFLGEESRLDSDHIDLGNTVSDDDNEVQLSFNGFEDSVLGEWGWDIDDAGISSSFLLGFSAVLEDGETEVSGSCLLWVNTSDHLGAVLESLFSLEGTLR
jgi:hypothetical protein